MKVGYARVSSEDQNLHLQKDALKQAGCERIYEEKESGGKADQPELLRLLDTARTGDTLMVWRLDCLPGRADFLTTVPVPTRAGRYRGSANGGSSAPATCFKNRVRR